MAKLLPLLARIGVHRLMNKNYSTSYVYSDSRTVPESVSPPPVRRLRGYAFDPSLSIRLDTASINHTVFEVTWEAAYELGPGPVGEYLEVLDFDPASNCWYEPVDLNHPELLGQDGLAPSEGNPQFHQQMVYAVIMKTIAHFEQALGRSVCWSSRYESDRPAGDRDVYVQRLRVYPHGMRGANAYYSPQKRALIFGYFMGPSGMVFTCLSHDIIVHEVTHAILDGMHRRYVEDNHPDTLAFHEAFADLIALFHHFTFPEVLNFEIAKTRGNLETETMLGQLAREFGEATGRYGALRDAIGSWDDQGNWIQATPDPKLIDTTFEPHGRGAILVSAMFGAFTAIYKRRTADLFRLATAGRGVLPAGDIHPDLVNRLASEAQKVANHFLNICIRALDYCPPVDITFGDYLRAMVTADFEAVPNDPLGYRIALIESFRRWGIVPADLRTLSEEQIRWQSVQETKQRTDWEELSDLAGVLRPMIANTLFELDRRRLHDQLTKARAIAHEYLEEVLTDKNDSARQKLENFESVTGLSLRIDDSYGRKFRRSKGMRSFEVHSLQPALRVVPDGSIKKQAILTITQREAAPTNLDDPDSSLFEFRGGCTLIFDLEGEAPQLRYAIRKDIGDQRRLTSVRAYRQDQTDNDLSLRKMYFGQSISTSQFETESSGHEPFRLLHED